MVPFSSVKLTRPRTIRKKLWVSFESLSESTKQPYQNQIPNSKKYEMGMKYELCSRYSNKVIGHKKCLILVLGQNWTGKSAKILPCFVGRVEFLFRVYVSKIRSQSCLSILDFCFSSFYIKSKSLMIQCKLKITRKESFEKNLFLTSCFDLK